MAPNYMAVDSQIWVFVPAIVVARLGIEPRTY